MGRKMGLWDGGVVWEFLWDWDVWGDGGGPWWLISEGWGLRRGRRWVVGVLLTLRWVVIQFCKGM